MGIIELLFLAVGLSMDAFAVAVCKGLAMSKISFKKVLICGLWFGGFQALMPFIGYILGVQFTSYVESITPWIAFVLLVLIGGNMLKEALSNEDEEANADLNVKTMFLLAVATSIDALAVGVTFACVPVNILPMMNGFINTFIGVIIIGLTTFSLSCVGVKIGNVFGTKYKNKAEIVGGVILICIGLKILLQHLGIL